MDKNLRGNTMKKIIILINVILSLIFITGCTNNDIVLNTDEEVLQYINESGFMDTIGKENLSIIDTIQIDDSKIVTDNMGQGTVSNELGVTDFIVRYNLNNGFDERNMAYIVISDGSKVSNVKMSVNDRIFNKNLEIGRPSVVLLNLRDVLSKDELEGMVKVDCRYFDIYNKELIVE